MIDKNEELFDSRVVKQNIKRGLVTIDDYLEYLSSSEDLSSETAPSEVKYIDQAADMDKEEVEENEEIQSP